MLAGVNRWRLLLFCLAFEVWFRAFLPDLLLDSASIGFGWQRQQCDAIKINTKASTLFGTGIILFGIFYFSRWLEVIHILVVNLFTTTQSGLSHLVGFWQGISLRIFLYFFVGFCLVSWKQTANKRLLLLRNDTIATERTSVSLQLEIRAQIRVKVLKLQPHLLSFLLISKLFLPMTNFGKENFFDQLSWRVTFIFARIDIFPIFSTSIFCRGCTQMHFP